MMIMIETRRVHQIKYLRCFESLVNKNPKTKPTSFYIAPSGIGDHSRFWLFCLGPLINYLAFQSFEFERTWWSLFQKRVVRIKFDIYDFNIEYSFVSIAK
jgi:hypothetical protein